MICRMNELQRSALLRVIDAKVCIKVEGEDCETITELYDALRDFDIAFENEVQLEDERDHVKGS